MSGVILTRKTGASVPTPDTGKSTLFVDSADGLAKVKDDAGLVVPPVPAASVTLAQLAAATKADWEYAYSHYKTLVRNGISVQQNTVAGTYILNPTTGAPVLFTANSGAALMYLDPADYAAGSRAIKYRVKVVAAVNATAPAQTLTVGLYPVTAGGGATTIVSLTPGTVQAGSTVAFASPGATSLNNANSGDFTAPAAGYYALGIVVPGTMPANSTVTMLATLQMRQV